MIFNIVFFISVTSVLIQGTTLSLVAKWLHVALPEKAKPIAPTDAFLSETAKTAMKEFKITPDFYAVGKKIVDLKFPPNAIIAMINRNEQYLTPNGATIIETDDVLYVLSDNEEGLNKVNDCLTIGIITAKSH